MFHTLPATVMLLTGISIILGFRVADSIHRTTLVSLAANVHQKIRFSIFLPDDMEKREAGAFE